MLSEGWLVHPSEAVYICSQANAFTQPSEGGHLLCNCYVILELGMYSASSQCSMSPGLHQDLLGPEETCQMLTPFPNDVPAFVFSNFLVQHPLPLQISSLSLTPFLIPIQGVNGKGGAMEHLLQLASQMGGLCVSQILEVMQSLRGKAEKPRGPC